MATFTFASSIQIHVPAPPTEAPGATLAEGLAQVFAQHPRLRGYLLDDQGSLRTHLVVFVDGTQIADRQELSDPLRPRSKVHVIQALSGG